MVAATTECVPRSTKTQHPRLRKTLLPREAPGSPKTRRWPLHRHVPIFNPLTHSPIDHHCLSVGALGRQHLQVRHLKGNPC